MEILAKQGDQGTHNKNFLDFTTENKEIKYLPHKNLNSKTLENDMDVQKFIMEDVHYILSNMFQLGKMK